MKKELDFTDCTVNKFKLYGGANGRKIGIVYEGETYMLKFPPVATKTQAMSYANSCISEYIACRIVRSLGIPVQETLLGRYGEKIVVACKDFETEGFRLKDFAFLKNAVMDSAHNGYGTELQDILTTIREQGLVSVEELETYFWELFIADAFLGNFDRHNGNWGFLIHEGLAQTKIAPVFDCGSCLYPQLDVDGMGSVLENSSEIEKRIFTYPTSAIKDQDVKINYGKFLMTTDLKGCLSALVRIYSRIHFDEIDSIIDDAPFIEPMQKTFFKTILRRRYDLILQPAVHRIYTQSKQVLPTLDIVSCDKDADCDHKGDELELE